MGITYKGTDGEWHLTDPQYKSQDSEWHYIKNAYEHREDGWHPAWSYSWIPGPWGQCTVPCGGGSQTRSLHCVRNDGLHRHPTFCSDILQRPDTARECNPQACGYTPAEISQCNRWSRLYFNSGRPIARSGVLPLDPKVSHWYGPGKYHLGVSILFTSHIGYWSAVDATAVIPGTDNITAPIRIAYTKAPLVDISGTLDTDGSVPWDGTRGDLLDGDGSGYYTHYYVFRAFYFRDVVTLTKPPTDGIYINFRLTGDGYKKNDGRMCSEHTFLRKID